MKAQVQFNRHIYWIDEKTFRQEKAQLKKLGYKVSTALKTPCETLDAQGNNIFYASPGVWSRVCVRQGSWYRGSDKVGKTLLISEKKLPVRFDRYLDAVMTESEFRPERFPSNKELVSLIDTKEYKDTRPDEWENPGIKDKVMFKILFTLTGFWGWGDNLASTWLTHRANHANFLARKVTTVIDGVNVPYSISDNSGICSSCVEFFNVSACDSRKLVAACPGSITFSKVERNKYYDVKPFTIPVKMESPQRTT